MGGYYTSLERNEKGDDERVVLKLLNISFTIVV
jgi:hypothetical protein